MCHLKGSGKRTGVNVNKTAAVTDNLVAFEGNIGSSVDEGDTVIVLLQVCMLDSSGLIREAPLISDI